MDEESTVVSSLSEDEEEPLEEAWADLGVLSPILLSTGVRASNVKGTMTLAAEKAAFRLRETFGSKYKDQPLTSDVLTDIVAMGVRSFMEIWYGELRGNNLAGLIEIVLEGQQLTPSEIQSFIHALSDDLILKITRSEVHSANGYHALMAIEHHRRAGRIDGYTIGLEGRRVFVEFRHTPKGEEPTYLKFYLDEKFDLESLP